MKPVATRSAPRTPTTVVLPFGGDRAMVTIDPGARASAADVAAHAPRAVAASLDQLYVVPEAAAAYVTCGDDDARAYAGRPPAALSGARVLFVNQREALGPDRSGDGARTPPRSSATWPRRSSSRSPATGRSRAPAARR